MYGTLLGDDDGERRRRNLADRREILERVVGQAGIDELIERVTACHQDQRVAIRRRLSQRLRGDDAAGARTVVDHRLLAPGLCQRLAERAREYVDRTARRIRHQDVDGLARKIFGACADADQQQCRLPCTRPPIFLLIPTILVRSSWFCLLRLIGATGLAGRECQRGRATGCSGFSTSAHGYC